MAYSGKRVMIEKDDWRLLNDVEYLKNKEINPTDGEEIAKHAPYLKKCIFCWNKVQDNPHQWWFIPTGMSWLDFVGNLYSEIIDDRYHSSGKQFVIPLTDVQKQELFERGVPEVFVTDIE